MKPNKNTRAAFIVGLIICILPLLAEARSRRYGGGSVEGAGAFLIGAPLYWFIIRFYLNKISHQFVAAFVLLLIMAALGPHSLLAGCLGVAATCFIGWPYLLPEDRIDPSFRGLLIVVNFFATFAAAILGFEALAKVISPHW